MTIENINMRTPKIKLDQFLRTEFSKKNLTLSKLAKETKIPKTCLHRWEAGVFPRLNEKNFQYFEKLSHYFNVPVHHILFGLPEGQKINEILFESNFGEGQFKYKLKIEKIAD